MSESEKKSRYTQAQKKAAQKYLSEKIDDIKVRVEKGKRAVIKDHADKQNESMNQYIINAIDERMQREDSAE